MIRKVSKKEFLRFLRDPSVRARLGVYPDKVRAKNLYVVDEGERLYFFYEELGDRKIEMHVGAIKEHRHMAKKLIQKALEFVKSLGYQSVITSAPVIYQSTINMALNFGFVEIDRSYSREYGCDMVYLERSL